MDGRGSFQDTSGRSGSLDAVALFSAVSVYCRRVTEPEDTPALAEALTAAAGGGPAVLLLPKDVQEAMIDVVNPVAAVRRDSLLADPGPIAEVLRRALYGSRSSPVSRWLATTPAGNSRNCARCCGPGSPRCPTRRTSVAHLAWGSRRGQGHRSHGPSTGRRRGLRSAVCLVIGTRLSVTARAGLDGALAGVDRPTRCGTPVCAYAARGIRRTCGPRWRR